MSESIYHYNSHIFQYFFKINVFRMTPCSLVAIHSEKRNCVYILVKDLDPQNEIKPLISHVFSV